MAMVMELNKQHEPDIFIVLVIFLFYDLEHSYGSGASWVGYSFGEPWLKAGKERSCSG